MARPIAKKSDIESGVVRVVARQGLAATTIKDIARAAGVSEGLLYRYWAGRDGLAAEVYQQHLSTLVNRLETAVSARPAATAKLDALVDVFLAFADREPESTRFLLMTQHDLYLKAAREFGVGTLLLPIVAEGMRAGHFREMPHDLAVQIVVGIVIQPMVGVLYAMLPGPAVRHAEEIKRALRGALGAPSTRAWEESPRER